MLNQLRPEIPKTKALAFTHELPTIDRTVYNCIRAFTDSCITGDANTRNDIFYGVYSELFGRAVQRGAKEQEYKWLVGGLRQLYHCAEEGKSVTTVTNIEQFNFGDVFQALGILGSQVKAASQKVGELSIYPLKDFGTDVKVKAVYKMLDRAYPDLSKMLKSHKLKLYITADFNLAVENRFWQCEDLTDALSKLRGFDRYKLSPLLTLYVLEPV